MNKILLIILILFMSLAYSKPSDNLDNFVVNDVEELPSISPENAVSSLGDKIGKNPNSAPLSGLSDSGAINKPLEPAKAGDGGTIKVLTVTEDGLGKILKDDVSPGYFYFTPLLYHSVKVFSYNKNYFIDGEFQFLRSEYKKLNLGKFLGGFIEYSPTLSLSLTKNLNVDKGYYFTVSGIVNTKVGKSSGAGIRLTASNKDFQKLELSHGKIYAYVYYNLKSLALDYDFLSLYAGWKSNQLIFKDFSKVASQAKDLIGDLENATFGVFYLMDVSYNWSFNFETNLQNYFLFGLNYRR